MANYLLCGCGQQVDTANRLPGEVVVCPKCGVHMLIPGESTEEFVRQLLATPNRPGVFAHVQLDNAGIAPKPVGWFRRLLRRLGLSK